MNYLRRMIGLLIVALVVLATFAPDAASQAQAPTSITVDGSALVAKILEAAKTAYTARTPDAKIDIGAAGTVSGTEGGFEKFCNGALDIAMAYGPITDAQIAACQSKNVSFVELLLGYDAVTVVVNTTSPVTCLSIDQLNKLLSPSAKGVNNWKTVDPTLSDIAITSVYGPPNDPNLSSRFLLDKIIVGEGLRDDIKPLATAAEVADKVNAETNSVGIMSLADFSATNKNIRAVQIKDASSCIDANAVNLDEGRYPAASSLYLYVNAASLSRQPVADFLNYLLSTDGRTAVTKRDYVLASSILYDRGQGYLRDKRTGRTYSRLESVNVPANTAGQITTDGSSLLFGTMGKLNDTFKPRFTQIVINTAAFGDDVGYSKLCSNNADVIGATRLPNDSEQQTCQSAGVQTLSVALGAENLVVVVNAKNDFAKCLKVDQIAKIFGADSPAKKWSDVDKSYPATDLMALTPSAGAIDTDFLLAHVVKEEVAPLRRLDAVENDDPLYRAAAIQNVDGAVTFMSFSDFTKASATSKVRAVDVDGGSGCVTPTQDTITGGKYPIATPLYLVFNVKSFSRPEVKAYVWFLLGDDALTVLQGQGLTGLDTAKFLDARDFALSRFSALESAPAGTAEPTAAATGAATTEPTAQPTATGTAEPTTVATIQPTVQPTATGTAEPTAAPTEQPTASSTSVSGN